jgi:hypothetical protein
MDGWPAHVTDVSFNSSPIVADVDADGSPDVVAAGLEAGLWPRVHVVALDSGGRLVSGWPILLETEEIITSSPVIVDLDGDGLLELVLGTEGDGRVFVWNLPTADQPSAVPWPMDQADRGRTGRWRPAGTGGAASLRTPAPAGARPEVVDPDDPLLTISFDLRRQEDVRLTILDVMGSTTRVLLDYELPPGRYKIVWDGRDDRNRIMPPGIYFYHLNIGPSSSSHQMLLLK